MDQLTAWQGVCAGHSPAWPDESQYCVMPSGQISSQVRFALFDTASFFSDYCLCA